MALGSPTRADPSGDLFASMTVRYRVQPSVGAAFECPEDTCVLVAVPTGQSLDHPEARGQPIAFEVSADAGPLQSGMLQLDRTSLTSGDVVLVTGSGWASRTTVPVAWCDSQSAICSPPTSIEVAADGTFTTNVAVTNVLVVDSGLGPNTVLLADCVASNACGIQAYDVRDTVATRVSAPLPVAARAGVIAGFDVRAPHVPEMSVRVVGSGFTPNDSVDLWQCDEVLGSRHSASASAACRRTRPGT